MNKNVEIAAENIAEQGCKKVSRKDEVFQSIMSIVTDEMDISADEILSKSKNADTVLARSILAVYLKRNGFSTNSIAKRLHKTSAAILNMQIFFTDKQKANKLLQISLNYIKKELESKGYNA